jgi:hypothetical protein
LFVACHIRHKIQILRTYARINNNAIFQEIVASPQLFFWALAEQLEEPGRLIQYIGGIIVVAL